MAAAAAAAGTKIQEHAVWTPDDNSETTTALRQELMRTSEDRGRGVEWSGRRGHRRRTYLCCVGGLGRMHSSRNASRKSRTTGAVVVRGIGASDNCWGVELDTWTWDSGQRAV